MHVVLTPWDNEWNRIFDFSIRTLTNMTNFSSPDKFLQHPSWHFPTPSVLWLDCIKNIQSHQIFHSLFESWASPHDIPCVWDILACMGAKLVQSCLTVCNPMDCSPPGSSVHVILQARILERVAISSSRESSLPRDPTNVSYVSCTGRKILYHECQLVSPWDMPEWKCKLLSGVQLFVTPWTIRSVEFSRPEYWSG